MDREIRYQVTGLVLDAASTLASVACLAFLVLAVWLGCAVSVVRWSAHIALSAQLGQPVAVEAQREAAVGRGGHSADSAP